MIEAEKLKWQDVKVDGTLSLEYLRIKSTIYLLDLVKKQAMAVTEIENGMYRGYTIHLRCSRQKGYYWDLETTSTGKDFISISLVKGTYDITESFEEAMELSVQHPA